MDFDATTIMAAFTVLVGAVAGLIKAGKFFSTFTETEKDDEFFAKAEDVVDGLTPSEEE